MTPAHTSYPNIRLSKNDALSSIEGAFLSLKSKSRVPIEIRTVGGIPILSTTDDKTIFTCLLSLSPSHFLQVPNASFKGMRDRLNELTSPGYLYNFSKSGDEDAQVYQNFRIAFVYSDQGESDHYSRKLKEELVLSLGDENKDDLWVVRADNHSGNSYSIAESITNLIATFYYAGQGYALRSDIGSGADLVAFRIDDLQILRQNLIFDNGLIEQLRLPRRFFKTETKRTEGSSPEIIAIETESYGPQKGINQLRSGFLDWFAKDVDWSHRSYPFDKCVLAVPAFQETIDDIDVLTYDKHGIEYRKSKNKNYAETVKAKHDSNVDVALAYFQRLIKKELMHYVKLNRIVSTSDFGEAPYFQFEDKISEFRDRKTISDIVQMIGH